MQAKDKEIIWMGDHGPEKVNDMPRERLLDMVHFLMDELEATRDRHSQSMELMASFRRR